MHTIQQQKDAGKTIILITHRLATAAQADHVIMLENGQLIEEGSYGELMNLKGNYYKMWQMQLPAEMKY